MSTRRGFLLGIGAALSAPAIVRAESIMKVVALSQSPSPILWPTNSAVFRRMSMKLVPSVTSFIDQDMISAIDRQFYSGAQW